MTRLRCAAIVGRVYSPGDAPVQEPCGRLAKEPVAVFEGRSVPACNVHRRGLAEGRFR